MVLLHFPSHGLRVTVLGSLDHERHTQVAKVANRVPPKLIAEYDPCLGMERKKYKGRRARGEHADIGQPFASFLEAIRSRTCARRVPGASGNCLCPL